MFRYLYHLLKNQKNGGRVMSNINKKRYPNVNDASLEKIHMKNRKLIFTLCYLAYSAIYIARLNLSVATPVLQELSYSTSSLPNPIYSMNLFRIFAIRYDSSKRIFSVGTWRNWAATNSLKKEQIA